MNEQQVRSPDRMSAERPLNGWREIASFFDVTDSTVKRWASQKGLPIHRVAGDTGRKGLPIYAFPSELESWLRNSESVVQGEPGSEADRNTPVLPSGSTKRHRSNLRSMALYAAVLASTVALVMTTTQFDQRQDEGQSLGSAPASEAPQDAKELYLRGTYLWNLRKPESLSDAVSAFEQALEIHPDYAEAYAGLAMTYNLLRQFSMMDGWTAYPKAEAAARRSVELDPTLDLAQAALAFVEFHWLWQVEEGLARFEEAVRLNPQSANTLMWYGSSLLHAGRYEDALPVINRAHELDPHNRAVFNMKAQTFFYLGQADQAAELLTEQMRREPDYAWSYYAMSFINLTQGDFVAYLENYAKLGELIGSSRHSDVADKGQVALQSGGVHEMLAAMVAEEKRHFDAGEALAWDVARIYGMGGNGREAMEWLDISLAKHEEKLIGVTLDPAFWPIRTHPRFKQLVADLGLSSDY